MLYMLVINVINKGGEISHFKFYEEITNNL